MYAIENGHLKTDAKSQGARHMLGDVERATGSEEPMLSAVVVRRAGGPVPSFRDILKAVGLAVPQTDRHR
ncbi:hypothetical protein ACFY9S_11025 [Streptomyces sp. NPDC012474]|uniref:hypothetical protein n=1 Tax=Streptomyces sp. NPDC012474 TaxID=3364836 RepID=UPI0036ED9D8E